MTTGTIYGMVTVKSSSKYTVVALQTFLKHTKLGPNDQFVLIDNDGDWINNWNNGLVRTEDIIVNDSPKNTSQNINQIIKLAEQNKQAAVFLSNDVIFTPNWNTRFIQNENVLSIPACNQTHNYGFPSSLGLEEFNNRYGLLNSVAHTHHVYEPKPFSKMLMPIYVCRIPYNIYSSVGLLDEDFNVGGEDVDYRIRLLSQGFDIKYCSSYLLHFDGRSSWNGAETITQTIERNHSYMSKFKEKWGDDLFNLCITTGNSILTIQKYSLHQLIKAGMFNIAIKKVLENA